MSKGFFSHGSFVPAPKPAAHKAPVKEDPKPAAHKAPAKNAKGKTNTKAASKK